MTPEGTADPFAPHASMRTGLSFPAACAMQPLADQGIVRELTGRSRNRLFAYDRHLSTLAEGTQVGEHVWAPR